MYRVNICGIPHDIIEVTNELPDPEGATFGEIFYDEALIKVNRDIAPCLKDATICHEIFHGILTHCGYGELSCDEMFVTAIGNALNQAFAPKLEIVGDKDAYNQ